MWSAFLVIIRIGFVYVSGERLEREVSLFLMLLVSDDTITKATGNGDNHINVGILSFNIHVRTLKNVCIAGRNILWSHLTKSIIYLFLRYLDAFYWINTSVSFGSHCNRV